MTHTETRFCYKGISPQTKGEHYESKWHNINDFTPEYMRQTTEDFNQAFPFWYHWWEFRQKEEENDESRRTETYEYVE